MEVEVGEEHPTGITGVAVEKLFEVAVLCAADTTAHVVQQVRNAVSAGADEKHQQHCPRPNCFVWSRNQELNSSRYVSRREPPPTQYGHQHSRHVPLDGEGPPELEVHLAWKEHQTI